MNATREHVKGGIYPFITATKGGGNLKPDKSYCRKKEDRGGNTADAPHLGVHTERTTGTRAKKQKAKVKAL